ncbi:MAG: periplasmic heavy metal sensor [Pseudomonadota bacterium]
MSEPIRPLEPTEYRAPRWMKVTLVISLAANLLVVGAFAGAFLSHSAKADARQMGPRGGPANVISEALPKNERRALGREIRRTLRAEPALRTALRKEITALAELMRAPEYTPEALEAQLMQIQSHMMGPLSIARAAMVEHLASFDEPRRMAYAARLEELLDTMRPK